MITDKSTGISQDPTSSEQANAAFLVIVCVRLNPFANWVQDMIPGLQVRFTI